MLSNLEDQRKPIHQLQSQIRQMASQVRQTEKAIYELENDIAEGSEDLAAAFMRTMQRHSSDLPNFHDRGGGEAESPAAIMEERLQELVTEVQDLKEEVNAKSEELDLRIRCFHEFQIAASNQKANTAAKFSNLGGVGITGDKAEMELRRKNEIFFSRAKWKLTETDGQLGIADVAISNFFYNKNNMKDDSAEHTLEIGSLYVKNLLPDEVYEDVIYPTDLPRDVPLDRHRTLRIFCREKPPVGGISVKAHFEINLVPITISITYNFYKKIMAFCFPEKADLALAQEQEYFKQNGGNKNKKEKKKKGKHKKSDKYQTTSFYVQSPLAKDDIEELKTRAQKNKLFVYIKIPEVPLCVSYKGERDKNKITDISNFVLQLPTIEYHNVTWTWLDLANAVKKQTKDSLVFQAVKQKLSLRSHVGGAGHHSLISSGSRLGVGVVTSHGSSLSLNSTMSSASTMTNETGSASGQDGNVFHKEDEVKAELLLGANKLMPKQRGGGSKK